MKQIFGLWFSATYPAFRIVPLILFVISNRGSVHGWHGIKAFVVLGNSKVNREIQFKQWKGFRTNVHWRRSISQQVNQNQFSEVKCPHNRNCYVM